MRDPAELKFLDNPDWEPEPIPTAKEIAAFERAHDLKLPADLVRLLSYRNGGYPKLKMVLPFGETDKANSLGVDHFLSLDQMGMELEDVHDNHGPRLLPVASVGNGDYFVLDFRTDPPSVKVTAHDAGPAELDDIAPTFGDFIDGFYYRRNPYLKPAPDDEP